MAVLCGWASIDENGKITGGKAGDQTGREVRIGSLYSFRQSIIIRYKDEKKGVKAGQICKEICNNPLVGYDQSQRMSLYNELKKVKWKVEKLNVKCEVDCSELCAVVANCVGVKVTPNLCTSNMSSVFEATKKLEVLKYNKNDLKPGDMIVAPGHHVIIVISV